MNEQSSAEPGAHVRAMVRRARSGALATLERQGGHPYASLVLVATLPDGAPVMLLSGLARHTRNLTADHRVSLLVDETSGSADPLAGGRATLLGRVVTPADPALARRRFLARHPSAAGYADFGDFAFHAVQIEHVHYVGGFGRIVELTAADVLLATEPAAALIEAEPDILAHMNQDHADAVALYATVLAGERAGRWRMVGIDPEGMDLASQAAEAEAAEAVAQGDGGRSLRAVRITFSQPLRTPADARRELAHLADAARGASRASRERLT